MTAQRVEQLADVICKMDRRGLIRTLRQIHCDFKLDFSSEFLDSISDERLRHIVLAASLHDHSRTSKCPA